MQTSIKLLQYFDNKEKNILKKRNINHMCVLSFEVYNDTVFGHNHTVKGSQKNTMPNPYSCKGLAW